MDERLVQFDEKMQKTMNNLSEEFGSIRAGRANPHVLDKLKVDYYGTPTAYITAFFMHGNTSLVRNSNTG